MYFRYLRPFQYLWRQGCDIAIVKSTDDDNRIQYLKWRVSWILLSVGQDTVNLVVISFPCGTGEPDSGNSTYCFGKMGIIPACKAIFVPAETNLCTYGAKSEPLKPLSHTGS